MGRTRLTPAKINLYLEITGRRADGYHELLTVFYPIPALHDELRLIVTDRPGIAIHCQHPAVPEDQSNLCYRAASAFAVAAGIQPAWEFDLEKRIPVAAGLGGGSSNAAGVLQLLNEQYANPLTGSQLADLAVGLGADVPFFLNPVPSQATGIGEKLTPVPCRAEFELVLLNPGFPIPAAWAYQHYDPASRRHPADGGALLAAMAAGDAVALARSTTNALEMAALRKFPLLEMMVDFLLKSGCLAAHVSGSGPTVYGIGQPGSAAAVAQAARAHFGPGMWIFAA